MHSLIHVDEVLEQCELRRPSEKAPHVPVAGTPTASIPNEELQEDLLFLGGIPALHATDVFSRYSLLIPVRPKNPVEVRGAFCTSQIGVSGQPRSIQMDARG